MSALKKVVEFATGLTRKSHKLRETILSLDSVQARFEAVYQRNFWGDSESRSGQGSTLEWTRDLRPEFQALLHTLKITSLFDAPCGDWNWMKAVQFPPEMRYFGEGRRQMVA